MRKRPASKRTESCRYIAHDNERQAKNADHVRDASGQQAEKQTREPECGEKLGEQQSALTHLLSPSCHPGRISDFLMAEYYTGDIGTSRRHEHGPAAGLDLNRISGRRLEFESKGERVRGGAGPQSFS